jgi:adenylate cyclase
LRYNGHYSSAKTFGKIRMSAPNPEVNALKEAQRAKELVEQVNASLNEQKDALRQRGMALPSQVVSAISGLELDFKRLEEYLVEEQTELGQLRALAQMSAAITTSLDVDTVLNEAMDIVIALTRAERGYIILVDRETNTLEFRTSRDDSITTASRSGGKPQVSNTILNEVLTTGKPLLTDNAYKDDRFAGGGSIASFALRSVLCVPLSYKDNIIGVAYVDNRLQAGIFTERELNTLVAFANIAAVAISNALLYSEIQTLLSEITQVKDLMDNIFDSIGSGVIATDARDTITTFNRAAETILATSAEETVGHKLMDVLPKLTMGLEERLEEVRLTNHSQTFETEMSLPEGGRVAVNLKFNPLKDSQDTTQGVALLLDDMTQQKEREQQLMTIKTYLPSELVNNISTIAGLALGGESREVTCIFAEVRSLYTMKDLHAREVLSIMNEYFAIATSCINESNGVIDKYMGTEIMAMFNTQLNPQDNHAELAIECALKIRDAFIRHYEATGIAPDPHLYRIGMHTGVCTLGNVGSISRRDFTALGSSINLAKRVEENTQYGSILLSQETYDHLMANHVGRLETYRFVRLADINAKGVPHPVPVYEAFRV